MFLKILNEYNPYKKHKILVVFYDIIADTLSNKKYFEKQSKKINNQEKKQIDAIMNQKKTLHFN